MPKIKRIAEGDAGIDKSPKSLTAREIENKLQQQGLLDATQIRECLDSNSLSIEDVVTRMGGVFHSTDQHKVVQSMGETFLKMHGALQQNEEVTNQINLVIQGEDIKVAGILSPARS